MIKKEKSIILLIISLMSLSVLLNNKNGRIKLSLVFYQLSCNFIDECIFLNHKPHNEYFDPYISTIEKKADKYLGVKFNFSIPVFFDRIDEGDYIAYCYDNEMIDKKFIVINEEYFQLPLENEKSEELELTILHEIGHCFFKEEHNDRVTNLGQDDNIPESVMKSSNININIFKKYEEYYYRKLILN